MFAVVANVLCVSGNRQGQQLCFDVQYRVAGPWPVLANPSQLRGYNC